MLAFGAHLPQFLPESVFIAAGARVIGQVSLGPGSSIWFNTVLRGDVHSITIGRQTNIQDNTVVHVTTGGHPTVIGDQVTIGHAAILHACTIGSRSLVGMGAIVLDGAIIPEDSMVGAGSLVTPGQTFPPGSLILGSPARLKRALTPQEILDLVLSARHYEQLAEKSSVFSSR